MSYIMWNNWSPQYCASHHYTGTLLIAIQVQSSANELKDIKSITVILLNNNACAKILIMVKKLRTDLPELNNNIRSNNKIAWFSLAETMNILR